MPEVKESLTHGHSVHPPEHSVVLSRPCYLTRTSKTFQQFDPYRVSQTSNFNIVGH